MSETQAKETPAMEVNFFEPQWDAWESTALELLVGGPEGPAGTSYFLRAVGMLMAASVLDIEVLLTQKSTSDLRIGHIEGPDGIVAMVAELRRRGMCDVSPSRIRFNGGGILRWTGLSTESEINEAVSRRIDVLLADEVHAIPEAIYQRLSGNVRNSRGENSRIIAASTKLSESGWVARYWNSETSDGLGFVRMSPDDIHEDLIKTIAVEGYPDFIDGVHGAEWLWPPHVKLIVKSINRWVDGEWDHIAIFVPAQHAKTTAGPRNSIPYVMKRYPSDWSSIVSYGSDLANSRSYDARQNYLKSGGSLAMGRRKVNEWENRFGGGCWSRGSMAGQAGRSATWVFLDDGDEDYYDAINATRQAKKRRRYTSVLRARESMFAAEQRVQKVMITSTRWDPEDLSGYALRVGHEAGENWAVLVLPALYDPRIADAYRDLYPNFHIIDDFRTEIGEPIWEERRGVKEWNKKKMIMGGPIFETECQQNPTTTAKGNIFFAEFFRRVREDPAFVSGSQNENIYESSCRAWDIAGTAGGGDWTAGYKAGRLSDGDVIIRHGVRAQLSPGRVQQLIAGVMILDGPDVILRIPIDPAAGGLAMAESIVKYLRRVCSVVGMGEPEIVAVRPRRVAHATMTAKAARARDLQSFATPPDWSPGREPRLPGGVSFVAAPWSPAVSDRVRNYATLCREWPEIAEIAELVAELVPGDWWTTWVRVMESFTGQDGGVDDDVDATVDAFDQIHHQEAAYSAVIRPYGA